MNRQERGEEGEGRERDREEGWRREEDCKED